MVNFTPRPFYLRGRNPLSIEWEVEWAQGRCERVWESSPPTGIDPRTLQRVASRYTDYDMPADTLKGPRIKVREQLKYWCNGNGSKN